MNIILLTHQRELKKKSNTGSIVVDVLGDQAEVIIWQRADPSPRLLSYIAQGDIALLYPSEDSKEISTSDIHEKFVIIDGTWQEAQKIYNRSPYLHNLPSVKINAGAPSAYNLRRNQRSGCLCTAECAIEVLSHKGFYSKASELQSELASFLSQAR